MTRIEFSKLTENHPDVTSVIGSYIVQSGERIHLQRSSSLNLELYKIAQPRYPLVPGLIEVMCGNPTERMILVLSESMARATKWRGSNFSWVPLRFEQEEVIATQGDVLQIRIYAPHKIIPNISKIVLEY